VFYPDIIFVVQPKANQVAGTINSIKWSNSRPKFADNSDRQTTIARQMIAAIVAALLRTLNRDVILNKVLEIALQNTLSTIKCYIDQRERSRIYRESEHVAWDAGPIY